MMKKLKLPLFFGFKILRSVLPFLLAALFLAGCDKSLLIVSAVDEREANEIIVFLASNGISVTKTMAVSSSPGASQTGTKWNILVNSKQSTEAMAILNQNGLPRIKGTNLLELFGKPGIMSSEKEGNIRYQAGLAEQIAGTIRKIDGVIDVSIQISFPNNDSSQGMPWEQTTPQKITAAVYVKHQGVLDDPNSHLVMKIKRLVSSSVQGLELNDVTIIADKARFTDINLGLSAEALSNNSKEKDYVNIWSIVMSKSSAARFRVLFFILSLFSVVFAGAVAWLIWKLYPTLKSAGGLKSLLSPTPFPKEQIPAAPTEEKNPPPLSKNESSEGQS